jgi:hypothetical protein
MTANPSLIKFSPKSVSRTTLLAKFQKSYNRLKKTFFVPGSIYFCNDTVVPQHLLNLCLI